MRYMKVSDAVKAEIEARFGAVEEYYLNDSACCDEDDVLISDPVFTFATSRGLVLVITNADCSKIIEASAK